MRILRGVGSYDAALRMSGRRPWFHVVDPGHRVDIIVTPEMLQPSHK